MKFRVMRSDSRSFLLSGRSDTGLASYPLGSVVVTEPNAGGSRVFGLVYYQESEAHPTSASLAYRDVIMPARLSKVRQETMLNMHCLTLGFWREGTAVFALSSSPPLILAEVSPLLSEQTLKVAFFDQYRYLSNLMLSASSMSVSADDIIVNHWLWLGTVGGTEMQQLFVEKMLDSHKWHHFLSALEAIGEYHA